jgi:hypothetical protein
MSATLFTPFLLDCFVWDWLELVENMERETGFEPATSSLGIHPLIESKSLARFCCDFLNLQRFAESAVSEFVILNEARMRQQFSPASGPHASLHPAVEMIGDVSNYWATA